MVQQAPANYQYMYDADPMPQHPHHYELQPQVKAAIADIITQSLKAARLNGQITDFIYHYLFSSKKVLLNEIESIIARQFQDQNIRDEQLQYRVIQALNKLIDYIVNTLQHSSTLPQLQILIDTIQGRTTMQSYNQGVPNMQMVHPGYAPQQPMYPGQPPMYVQPQNQYINQPGPQQPYRPGYIGGPPNAGPPMCFNQYGQPISNPQFTSGPYPGMVNSPPGYPGYGYIPQTIDINQQQQMAYQPYQQQPPINPYQTNQSPYYGPTAQRPPYVQQPMMQQKLTPNIAPMQAPQQMPYQQPLVGQMIQGVHDYRQIQQTQNPYVQQPLPSVTQVMQQAQQQAAVVQPQPVKQPMTHEEYLVKFKAEQERVNQLIASDNAMRQHLKQEAEAHIQQQVQNFQQHKVEWAAQPKRNNNGYTVARMWDEAQQIMAGTITKDLLFNNPLTNPDRKVISQDDIIEENRKRQAQISVVPPPVQVLMSTPQPEMTPLQEFYAHPPLDVVYDEFLQNLSPEKKAEWITEQKRLKEEFYAHKDIIIESPKAEKTEEQKAREELGRKQAYEERIKSQKTIKSDPLAVEDDVVRDQVAQDHAKHVTSDDSAPKAESPRAERFKVSADIRNADLDGYDIIMENDINVMSRDLDPDEGSKAFTNMPVISMAIKPNLPKLESARFMSFQHTGTWNDEFELLQSLDYLRFYRRLHNIQPESPTLGDAFACAVYTNILKVYDVNYTSFLDTKEKIDDLFKNYVYSTPRDPNDPNSPMIPDNKFNDDPVDIAERVYEILKQTPTSTTMFLIERIMNTYNELYIRKISNDPSMALPTTWEGFKEAINRTKSMMFSREISGITVGIIGGLMADAIKQSIDFFKTVHICDPEDPKDIGHIIQAQDVHLNIMAKWNKYDLYGMVGEDSASGKEIFYKELKSKYLVVKEPMNYIFYRPGNKSSIVHLVGLAEVIELEKPTSLVPSDITCLHHILRESDATKLPMTNIVFFDDSCAMTYAIHQYPDGKTYLSRTDHIRSFD
jgi:hypothetical protein